MTALLTTEDTLVLDEMLGHEAKCESLHTARDNPICSGAVTHQSISYCDSQRTLLCSMAARAVVGRIIQGGICPGCRDDVRLDWQVLPA